LPQPVDPKEELHNKLKQKLREKQLERTSKFVRNTRMDKIEEKLEESTNPSERRKLKEELGLLEKIQEKHLNSFSGEFPEYGDNCDYGGSMERSD
jgi:hypothetical protein